MPKSDERRSLIIRDVNTRKQVDAVLAHPSNYERVMSGLLRNMGEDFYIDDSAFDQPEVAGEDVHSL